MNKTFGQDISLLTSVPTERSRCRRLAQTDSTDCHYTPHQTSQIQSSAFNGTSFSTLSKTVALYVRLKPVKAVLPCPKEVKSFREAEIKSVLAAHVTHILCFIACKSFFIIYSQITTFS